MSARKIKVTGEQLKSFVRGEISFLELTDIFPVPENMAFIGGDGYKINLDDFTAGIKSYRELNASGLLNIDDFFDYWLLTLLYDLGDLIGLPEMVGRPGVDAEDLDVCSSWSIGPFFENEAVLAHYVYSRLFELDFNRDELKEDHGILDEEFKEILEIIADYPENAGKPRSEWKLTVSQKRQFVYNNDRDDALIDADEETVKLWKKYLEELVAQDDVNAVKILGYACYGDDNPTYECDWERSRDCMLKLMEIAHDEWKAMAANTLGYIYYYGRTNGGVPQYDEAYKYFSLAAFFGYYEAIYKVGDMIMAGKGTPKNETAAFRMYRCVYNDCFPKFLEDGIGDQFTDAALRLGGAYHKGKGVYPDLMRAYAYYLQARVAIDNRMKVTNFFGNTSVSAGIRNSISDIRRELGDSCR